ARWGYCNSAEPRRSLVRESAVKSVGKADALIGHVRFDERGWETGRRSVRQYSRPSSTLQVCAERVLERSPTTCCLRSLFLGFNGARRKHNHLAALTLGQLQHSHRGREELHDFCPAKKFLLSRQPGFSRIASDCD